MIYQDIHEMGLLPNKDNEIFFFFFFFNDERVPTKNKWQDKKKN